MMPDRHKMFSLFFRGNGLEAFSESLGPSLSKAYPFMVISGIQRPELSTTKKWSLTFCLLKGFDVVVDPEKKEPRVPWGERPGKYWKENLEGPQDEHRWRFSLLYFSPIWSYGDPEGPICLAEMVRREQKGTALADDCPYWNQAWREGILSLGLRSDHKNIFC